MKILLAEDDSHISFLMKLTLEKMGGHEVIVCGDGEAAMKEALANSYDLILLDGMMPKKDGFTVCKELREQHHNVTPIIFLSAKSQQQDIALGLSMGAIGYIEKPFDPKNITQRIEDLYAARSAS